jgi:hypothetical protein
VTAPGAIFKKKLIGALADAQIRKKSAIAINQDEPFSSQPLPFPHPLIIVL